MAVVSDRSAVFVCLPIECAWHRVAVCSAHGCAGSIASPFGGPLPFGHAARRGRAWRRQQQRIQLQHGSCWRGLAMPLTFCWLCLSERGVPVSCVDASQMGRELR